MITLAEAKKRQAELQKTADAVVDHFKLKEILKPFGELYIHGGYGFGLMVKPDIDFFVFNNQGYAALLSRVADLAKDLTVRPGIGMVRVADNASWPKRAHRSIYLGLSLIWHHETWSVDIHFMKRSDMQETDKFDIGWGDRLFLQQKDAALLIKWQLKEQKRYEKDYWSADVYCAVLAGARSIEDLVKYSK